MEEKEQEPRQIPHVLCVQMGASQHAFEMESREEAVSMARTALKQGWVEIENERVYLLAMSGPNSGIGFLVMSKADVMAQQVAAARAAQQLQPQNVSQRLIRPNGR